MHKHPSCSVRVAAGKRNLLRRLYGQTFSSLLKEAAALCRSSHSVFPAEAGEPTCWALVWGAIFIRQEGMQRWFYKQQSCKQVWAFSRALRGRTPSGQERWRLARGERESEHSSARIVAEAHRVHLLVNQRGFATGSQFSIAHPTATSFAFRAEEGVWFFLSLTAWDEIKWVNFNHHSGARSQSVLAERDNNNKATGI